MKYEEALLKIVPADGEAVRRAKARWASIAKPLDSLGVLETDLIKIAGMKGDESFALGKKAVIAMCADNGVVEEGVTQTGQEVTAIVTENMSKGLSCVCQMARVAGADVFPVDIGVYRPVVGEKILQKCVRRCTGNIAKGPAMTPDEAKRAIETGIGLVGELKERGYGVFATGEMGIGNTTTSSAVVSVLLGQPVENMTGRGAGLSTEGYQKKINAIKRAVEVNRPDPDDAFDVLRKVGGLDLAGLVGVFLGGAGYHVPVVIDGFISAAAALVAQRVCPAAKDYMLGSHISREPAGRMLMAELGAETVIDAGMCLGEGTGAVAFFPILDMALAVYRNMTTFEATKIEAYVPQK